MKLQGKLKQYLDKIDKEVRELYTMVREVPNTKREIRDLAWQMRSTMSLIMSRQIQELMEGCELEKAIIEEKIETSESETQTEILTEKKQTRTISTQTDESGPEERNRRWEKEVMKVNSIADYQKIKDKRWPEKLYTKVKITVGNRLTAANEGCTLVIAEEKDKSMTKYVQKMYAERYPELLDMQEEFEVLESITRRKTAKGASVETMKQIIKITTNGKEEDLWDKLQRAREFAEEKQVSSIRSHKLLDVDANMQRKLLQTVFSKSNTTVDMYVPNRPVRQTQQAQSRPGGERRTQVYESEAIEIVKKGAGYSDVLKEVKTSLGGSDAAKGIKTIRSTKTGSILVILDKNSKDTDDLRRTIAEKMPQCQVRGHGQKRQKEKTKSLFIRSMEGTVTKEKVEAAPNGTLNVNQRNQVEIGEIRPSRFDTATVTLRVSAETSRVLLEKRTIRVGLSEGLIEESDDVIKCHRCWGYGHMARDCDAKQYRRTDCYKCGKSGHKAGECEEETHCPLCDRTGH